MPTTSEHPTNLVRAAELQSEIARLQKELQEILRTANPGASSPGSGGSHFQKLAEIRELRKGWDSYDAEPPSEVACDLAITLLGSLEQHALSVAFITATSDASIMLKHDAGTSIATWEIDGDGEIGVMVESPGLEPEYFSPTADGIGALVKDLARHG